MIFELLTTGAERAQRKNARFAAIGCNWLQLAASCRNSPQIGKTQQERQAHTGQASFYLRYKMHKKCK
jgi:hypothetical protein